MVYFLSHSISLLHSIFLSSTVLYPPFHFLYFLHAMSISSTLSIDHSNISFLQSIIFPIFTHFLLYFTPFSVLLSVVSLFTLSLLSLSMALFTLLSFFLSL